MKSLLSLCLLAMPGLIIAGGSEGEISCSAR